jgi:hypothetical protein
VIANSAVDIPDARDSNAERSQGVM